MKISRQHNRAMRLMLGVLLTMVFMLGVLLTMVFMLGVLPVCAQPPNNLDYDSAKEMVAEVRAKKATPEKLSAEGKLNKSLLLAIVGDETLIDVGRGLWHPGEEVYLWAGFAIEKFHVVPNDTTLFPDVTLRVPVTLQKAAP